MEFEEITKMQIEMDERHGFPVSFSSDSEKYQQLTKDLVGLFGEVGEFSNIVKKINIKIDHPEDYNLDINKAEGLLKEELIDSLIYIIRIGAILGVDLQSQLVKKIRLNESRYAKLRRK